MSILITKKDILIIILKYLKIEDLINISKTCHNIYSACKSNIIWMHVYENTWNIYNLNKNLIWKDICVFRFYMMKINCINNILNNKFYSNIKFNSFYHSFSDSMFSEEVKFIDHLSKWKENIIKKDEIVKKLCQSTYFIPYKCYRNNINDGFSDYCNLSWIIFGSNNSVHIKFTYICEFSHRGPEPYIFWKYKVINIMNTTHDDLIQLVNTYMDLEEEYYYYNINDKMNELLMIDTFNGEISENIENKYNSFIKIFGYDDITPQILAKYLQTCSYLLPKLNDDGLNWSYDFVCNFAFDSQQQSEENDIEWPEFYQDNNF